MCRVCAIHQHTHVRHDAIAELKRNVDAAKAVAVVSQRVLVPLPGAADQCISFGRQNCVPDDNLVSHVCLCLVVSHNISKYMRSVPRPHAPKIYVCSREYRERTIGYRAALAHCVHSRVDSSRLLHENDLPQCLPASRSNLRNARSHFSDGRRCLQPK
jgi:hypothetical protein